MIVGNSMRFDHLGIVVQDLGKGRSHFSRVYGVDKWTDEFNDEINGVFVQFGKGGGDICYELVAPINDKSPIYNVISRNMNILNHIAYIADEINVTADILFDNNFMALGDANSAIAYNMRKIQFFYSKELNYILELIEAPEHSHDYRLLTDQ